MFALMAVYAVVSVVMMVLSVSLELVVVVVVMMLVENEVCVNVLCIYLVYLGIVAAV